jgi:hypothetical protein
MGATPDEND